jgi:predicted nucleic acid-binding protein
VIFVDTSFWIAWRNRRDNRHAAARALGDAFAAERLVTTNHVRGETWTFLRRRVGHGAAVGFLDALAEAPRLRVVHVSKEMEAAALDWLRRRDDRNFSFVDATSFSVMRTERIGAALAFDGGFSAAGFQELR